MRSLVVVVLLAGCGSKPDLVGPGGVPDATSRASLSIDPPSAEIASLDTQQFTIKNTGEDSTSSIVLEITGANSLDFLIAEPSCTVLAPGNTCMVGVYSFGRVHDAMAKLQAFDSVEPSIGATADLTSSGDSLAVSIPTIPNTPINGTSAIVTATVTNPTSMASGTLSIGFSDQQEFVKVSDASSDTCTGQSLAVGGPGCSFDLVFQPNGDPSNTMRMSTVTAMGMNVSGATQVIGPIVPLITVDTTLASGTTLLNCASPIDSKVFTYTNPTGLPLTMTLPALANGGSSGLDIHMTTCTTTLGAGQSCTVALIATTTATGPRTGTLEVKATQGNASLTLDTPIAVTVGCDFVASPGSLSFSIGVGTSSLSKMVTVMNTSMTVSHTVTTALGGTDKSQFTIVSDLCNTVTLAPGGMCQVMLAYHPTMMTGASATLTVSTLNRAPIPIALTGTPLQSTLTFDKPGGSFATTAPTSMSPPISFTLRSTVSTGPITISTTGPFTQTNNCTALDSSTTCTVNVIFAPTMTGTGTGTLTAVAATGLATATLGGDAVAELAIAPSFASFTSLTGAPSQPVTFTVTNLSGALTGAISVQTVDPTTTYQFSNGCTGVKLDANGTCTFTVTFAAVNDANESSTLAVSATPGGTAYAMLNGISGP